MRDDRMIAGVCAGLAVHLGVPVKAVRIAMLVLALLGGAGFLLYLWLWATVPHEGETEGVVPLRRALTRAAEPTGSATANTSAAGATDGAAGAATRASGGSDRGFGAGGSGAVTSEAHTSASRQGAAGSGVVSAAESQESWVSASGNAASLGTAGATTPARRRGQSQVRWPVAELLLGVCLLVVGIGLVLDRLGVAVNLDVVLPGLAVLVGLGLTWWQVADRDRPDRHHLPRVLGALALVAVGVLMFFVTSKQPSMWTVITAALAVLAGVALAIAPWLLRVNRELIAERAARVREAERSDIAAHLHDSVLQTLALIQQRSEPGSEIARIARGQERELREWLFRGADGAAPPQREAVATELGVHAAALEREYPVRFEIVSVGSGDTIAGPEPIVAAAREAMLNAARHAGGDVTVFLEVARNTIAIDVTDRGAGVDLGALPEGRMGVRESILGRMERAGGTAAYAAGPGGGTSVRLAMPLADGETLTTATPQTPEGTP